MLKVLLADVDRHRYGLPDEPIDVDLSVLMQDEAEELDDYGIDPDGKAWKDWLNSGGVRVYRVLVWLALRRHGVELALAETKFDRKGVRWFQTEPESGEPGKADASETSESPGPDDSSPDTPT